MVPNANPLAIGFYSVPEAARLMEVASARRIYGWLRGYADRTVGPLISRQLRPLGGIEELSFLDLMELRLVEMLREQNVRPKTIRGSIEEARKLFRTDKPFATDKIVLKTDGRSVFVEEVLKKIAKDENDRRLWNLITKQYEHYDLIEKSLLNGVTFDPRTHLARTWRPRPKEFPDVMIDPRIAYGRPATPKHVPTRSIYELWLAEGKDTNSVADWFDMPVEEAEMAIKFEHAIAVPTQVMAA